MIESQSQIQRLEWITHNLLDLSRLDAGLMELDLAENDLGEIITAAITPFQTLASEKGVSLETELPTDPVVLLSDRARLEIALTNLLDNALKFTPAGGEVTVSLEQAADQVLLQVRDTGVGITPQDLPHIFERFYRGRSHNSEGSGLGLAITKSIIEAHGGQVGVESAVGQGTLFTLTFHIK